MLQLYIIADLVTNLAEKAYKSGKKSNEIKKLSEALEKEIENARVLKKVIDTQNSETSENKHFIDCANKTLKSKDKESRTQSKRIKEDIAKFKNGKSKAEKHLTFLKKKTEKDENKSESKTIQACPTTVENSSELLMGVGKKKEETVNQV